MNRPTAVCLLQAVAQRDEEDIKAVKTVKVNPHKVDNHRHTRRRIQCTSGALVALSLTAHYLRVVSCCATATALCRVVVSCCQVTIAQIQSTFSTREKEREKERFEEEKRRQRLLSQDDLPTENVNQLERDRRAEDEKQFGKGGVVSARTLDEAIGSLSVSLSGAGSAAEEDDRHPEKRLKAAYKEYEEAHWDELKADNPSLRHSQLKELLWRQWQKAAENPLNQAAQREREAAKGKATATSAVD